jgi:hypothetical protein
VVIGETYAPIKIFLLICGPTAGTSNLMDSSSEILGSHGGDYEEDSLLGYCAV